MAALAGPITTEPHPQPAAAFSEALADGRSGPSQVAVWFSRRHPFQVAGRST